MNRRKFIKRGILATLGAGLFTGLYTWQIEPFWLEFVKRKMPVANLPKRLIGKTIMQISDIHIGDRFDYHFIIDSFEKAKKWSPDYVVYTGDYIQNDSKKQFIQLPEVLKHCVKGKLGTFGVLGNHDYGMRYTEQNVADEVCSQLSKAGIEVLQNTQKEAGGLNFIGFDDVQGLNFYPHRVMNYYNESKANVVLCHNPDVCDLDVWNGYKGWILAGHTHGGQCKPPFFKPPILPVKNKRYTKGEIDLYDGRKLYINRALGHLKQVRFNVRPEITIFELEKA
ncbi:phosphoesterase [Flammeovirga aprica JL-4]|uniref:Phosphoesterase n=2 Tax=Flammeovirga aprica TaxID=29528 RepID=A0A7X9X9W9_9BACT|nr:phosphoesterase [Flammeovirga aprica JL-4]